LPPLAGTLGGEAGGVPAPGCGRQLATALALTVGKVSRYS
jgi:hypothetical protein